MEDLFSEEWAKRFSRKWNNNTEMVEQLAAANFDSVVALGYPNHSMPEVVLEITQGRITNTRCMELNNCPDTDWDLRAEPEQWEKWRGNGPGITGLGVAVASRQLQFIAGDYRRMIRQPLLAGPFLKFFTFL